jgi:hypothetical protein
MSVENDAPAQARAFIAERLDQFLTEAETASTRVRIQQLRRAAGAFWYGQKPGAVLAPDDFQELEARFWDLDEGLRLRFLDARTREPDPPDVYEIEPDPPTVDTFFHSPKDGADEERIARTEARLGVAFPPLLRALFRKSDGGGTDFAWCAARPDAPSRFEGAAASDDFFNNWRCAVQDDKLAALDHLSTMAQVSERYEDPEDEDALPKLMPGCDRLIVLAAHGWDVYLCLDARTQAPGVLLFDLIGEPNVRATWPSFEAFFHDLRRRAETICDGERLRGDRYLGPV